MNHHFLVTYATRAGSTAEVASVIGDVLGERGFSVDVKPIKEAPQVEGYGAILIGSAVQGGQWLPEAIQWIKTNQKALQNVPVALFTVHMNNTGDDEQSRKNREAYLNAVRSLLHPVDVAFFAGKMDAAQLSFLERFLVRIAKSPVGDLRDWERIRSWAQSVQVETMPH
jgi:menaquinone-dependent protoporphyrinogen oxidase